MFQNKNVCSQFTAFLDRNHFNYLVRKHASLVQKNELHEHIPHSAYKNTKKISNSDSFFSFFVQNEFNFNKNKTKVAYLSHTFNK